MESLKENVRSVNNDSVGENPLSLYPIVMDSVKTSRSASSDDDEDEEEEEEDWANQLAVRSNGLSPGSTVRIEHSSDVVIGPVTQFHGPVTIYQNVNAECKQITSGAPEKSKTETNLKATLASDNIPRKQHTVAEILEKTPTKRLLIYSSIVLSTLIIVIIAIIWSLKIFEKTEKYTDTTTETFRNTDAMPPNLNLTIYTRDVWDGDSIPDGMELLKHPVLYVVVAHTGGSFCETFADCSIIVKNIKQWHQPKDIWYSFLIGGDGSVYVGRGWNVKPNDGNAIVIALIGDYEKRRLPPVMMSTLERLLVVGLEMHKLDENYKLVCHNQTKPTVSPGINVYELVSKLPHFFRGGVKI